ncbi:MAG: aminotransferase class I/II-fold pyridoxal phosphate-dependent enzyme, partial [Pseudomonadota bacterium]
MVPRKVVAFMIQLAIPDIREEDCQAVDRVLRSGLLVNGPEIQKFEEHVAAWVGAHFGVAVANGTAAITLALRSAGIGPGDEVLVPAFTFPATAHAVVLSGAQPMLVDVDPQTWN